MNALLILGFRILCACLRDRCSPEMLRKAAISWEDAPFSWNGGDTLLPAARCPSWCPTRWAFPWENGCQTPADSGEIIPVSSQFQRTMDRELLLSSAHETPKLCEWLYIRKLGLQLPTHSLGGLWQNNSPWAIFPTDSENSWSDSPALALCSTVPLALAR